MSQRSYELVKRFYGTEPRRTQQTAPSSTRCSRCGAVTGFVAADFVCGVCQEKDQLAEWERQREAEVEPRLVASVSLAKIEGFLRGMADAMDWEADFRERANRDTDDVIRGWARDTHELVRRLERFRTEELRALLEARS